MSVVIVCPNCGAKNKVDPARAQAQRPVCGKCHAALPAVGEQPVTVTDETFSSVVDSAAPVLVDAWAPWCGPCRMIAPILDELARESGGRYVIAKLNVDENPRTAEAYRIASIPTMLLFKNGALVDQIVGVQPKAALASRLARFA